jgi:hypothetical protein
MAWIREGGVQMEEIRVGEVSTRCWLGRAKGAMRPRLEAGGPRQPFGSDVVPSGEGATAIPRRAPGCGSTTMAFVPHRVFRRVRLVFGRLSEVVAG